MNPIERLKQSSNITEKIYVSYNDRIGLDFTSKGSQTRWYKNGLFIKLDYLGYEGLSEELVSKLLDFSNVNHVRYTICEIYEDNKFIGSGCYSENFLQEGEQLHTFASILKRYNKNYASFTYYEVFESMYDATHLDVRKYLDQCLCVDDIVKNEDRHFNNLAVIKCIDNTFKPSPIFDNGLSCLSDTFTFPYNVSLEDNLDNVYAKPFYVNFKVQLKLVNNIIKINKNAFLNNIDKIRYGRAYNVVLNGLDELEGLAWE